MTTKANQRPVAAFVHNGIRFEVSGYTDTPPEGAEQTQRTLLSIRCVCADQRGCVGYHGIPDDNWISNAIGLRVAFFDAGPNLGQALYAFDDRGEI